MPLGFRQYVQLSEAAARARSRTSWNERLSHWERPASENEEGKILRAAGMARQAIDRSLWLRSLPVTVQPQGSYHNNTNVRLEADMDLRIQLPQFKMEYAADVHVPSADSVLGYVAAPNLFDLAAQVRAELAVTLTSTFGNDAVDVSGKKAIRVHGLDGSRTDCDVVPAFNFSRVEWSGEHYLETRGVAILGKDGAWTFNYPEQHYKNGVEKRARTQHRFKRYVRMLKRLNGELEDIGYIQRRLPSFLVECIVYRVPDEVFTLPLGDLEDLYGRLLLILQILRDLLNDPDWIATAHEINDIKTLFNPVQPWNVASVRAFVSAAIARLED